MGCGTSTFDLMVAEILDKGSVYGIDVSSKMIKIAKRRAEQRVYGD